MENGREDACKNIDDTDLWVMNDIFSAGIREYHLSLCIGVLVISIEGVLRVRKDCHRDRICFIIDHCIICPGEETTSVRRGDVQPTFLGCCTLFLVIGVLLCGKIKRCLDLCDERKLTRLVCKRIVGDDEIDLNFFLSDGIV